MKHIFILLLSLFLTYSISAQTSKVMHLFAEYDTLWVGTFGGLVKYNINTDKSFCYTTANSGLPSNQIHSFAKDSKGNLWVGCYTGGVGYFKNGICKTKFEGSDTAFYTRQYCQAMFVAKNDTVYFGSVHKLVRIYNNHLVIKSIGAPTSSDFQSVNHIVYAPDGNLLMATDMGLYKYANGTMTRVQNMTMQCNVLKYDKSGNLWIGTQRNGLYKYKNDTLIHYDTLNSICPQRITGIVIDKNDNIWIPISTLEKSGLINFKEAGNSEFYKSSDIENFSPYCIEYGDSCIWAGSLSKGLYRFSLSNYTYYKVDLAKADLNEVQIANSANSIDIYPVPVKDNLNIEIPICSSYKIEIIDSSAKLVFLLSSEQNIQTSLLQNISIPNLTQGMYILKLITDDRIYLKKMIKL